MALPPPQPVYILRGHAAQVHALEFSPDNSHLLSGDAEGYVVCWSLASKRAVASWRAHTSAVLGVAWWTSDIIVTHGRDNKLHLWRLTDGLDTILPVDRIAHPELPMGKKPTSVHTMTVNTLNFCSFTWTRHGAGPDQASCYLLALPHTLSSEAIDIFEIKITNMESDGPGVESIRKTTIPAPAGVHLKTGLTMCLAFHDDQHLLVGYESGATIVYARKQRTSIDVLEPWEYKPSYVSQPHSQPILSIQNMPRQSLFVTTAADSKLATHRIPKMTDDVDFITMVPEEPCHLLNTKHSGQQGLSIRNDGMVMATAGWDGRGRVYKAPSDKSDGEVAAVGEPKQKAVLKWHKEGCYCTAFAHISGAEIESHERQQDTTDNDRPAKDASSVIIRNTTGQVMTAAQRREHKAQTTHWLALGSKDGKISLWDIF